MIKDVMSSGRYVQVSSGGSSTYVNNYGGQQGVGNMRYNTSTQNMEVYDGNNWIHLSMGIASVGLTGEAEALLDWARKERDKQIMRESRIRQSPALQKAYENIKRAEENFDLLEALVKDELDNQSVTSGP